MTPVEQMDRTLVRRRPEDLPVLEILGKLDIMFCTREPNPPDIRAALDLVTVVQVAIGERFEPVKAVTDESR